MVSMAGGVSVVQLLISFWRVTYLIRDLVQEDVFIDVSKDGSLSLDPFHHGTEHDVFKGSIKHDLCSILQDCPGLIESYLRILEFSLALTVREKVASRR